MDMQGKWGWTMDCAALDLCVGLAAHQSPPIDVPRDRLGR